MKIIVKNKQGEDIELLQKVGKDPYWEDWHYLDKDNKRISHRDNDQPACIYSNGDRCWYQHGKLHRETGAAAEYHNGYLEYWYHGKFLGRSFKGSFKGYTQEQFKQYKKLLVFL